MSAIEFNWKYNVQCRNCTFSIDNCSTLDSAQSAAAGHINDAEGTVDNPQYPYYNHTCEITQVMLAGRDT